MKTPPSPHVAPVLKNVEEIARPERAQSQEMPFGERASLAVTNVTGTPGFGAA